ncbi:MAG TPA: hypothetical protein VG944_23775 [Fimbriimonas sp.]|nr:hypothetical protein [Fimbriimonas sp.]
MFLMALVAGAPNGNEIIRQMEQKYAKLQSYQDVGEYTAIDEDLRSGRKFNVHLRFKTEFKAPAKLCFKFEDGKKSGVLCSKGQKGKATLDPDLAGVIKPSNRTVWLADSILSGKKERNSLELEIASFAGVSYGTAYNVPTMLFPKIGGRQFHDLQDAAIIGTEAFDGEKCYLVESQSRQETLWIGTKTLALRRIVERSPGEADEVTVYHPVFNPKIPDSVFKLSPPINR